MNTPLVVSPEKKSFLILTLPAEGGLPITWRRAAGCPIWMIPKIPLGAKKKTVVGRPSPSYLAGIYKLAFKWS
ncbi:MAG: hypothetical protein RMI90_08235, partial [Thermoguttaceae bacterium]|nr:hypothetical protein [Thermoguttaceae bacterium]